jgi:hypothetical protein
MIRDALRNLQEAKGEDSTLGEIGENILNYLRGVIMVSNEKELDELLLCGLFGLKVWDIVHRLVLLQTVQRNVR